MTSAGDALEYRQLRTPRTHGATLVDPPWSAIPRLLDANRSALARHESFDMLGRSLHTLAAEARQTLLALADAIEQSDGREDAASLAWPIVPSAASGPGTAHECPPIILTGHQPQLFHPGVWFKNFTLDSVARRCAARPINLVIDNDTIRQAAIKVPTGSAEHPRVVNETFDETADEVPFEQRRVLDAPTWDSFAERVRAKVAPLITDPLVTQLWPDAIDARRRGASLGWCLSVARRRLERTWGLTGGDVPLSVIADTTVFRWFAAHLLAHAPRLRGVYNEALDEYRRVHRIRSRSHPVPALAENDGWVECPFWIWSDQSPRRARLFARRVGSKLELTDRARLTRSIDLSVDGDATDAVEQLGEWRAAGVKIRPRALVTTLFARLLLSDLFLHGIGGAKYDQLTDAIARRFLGVELPRFLTLTATLCLPIPHRVVTAADVRDARQSLREMRFHPERFLDESLSHGRVAADDSGARSDSTARLHSATPADATTPSDRAAPDDWRALVARKRELIERPSPRGARLEWHRELSRINEALQPRLDAARAARRRECDERAADAARHALLASREYAYCLFPAQVLRDHLLELSSLPR